MSRPRPTHRRAGLSRSRPRPAPRRARSRPPGRAAGRPQPPRDRSRRRRCRRRDLRVHRPGADHHQRGQRRGLDPQLTTSWIFGIYAFGGLISLVLGLYYKIPVTGAWSIPGAVLVVGALGSFEFAELVGRLPGRRDPRPRPGPQWPHPEGRGLADGPHRDGDDRGRADPLRDRRRRRRDERTRRRPGRDRRLPAAHPLVRAVPGVVGALAFGVAAAALTGAFGSAATGPHLLGAPAGGSGLRRQRDPRRRSPPWRSS